MWLFLVEAYLFVLIAFTLGAVVGLAGVRFGVRRLAPPPAPKPKTPKAEKMKGRRGESDAETPETPAEAGATSTGGAA